MDIGIVTARVSEYGGSEIYLLECIRRWQHSDDITVYTQTHNRKLFKEFNISSRVKIKKLSASPSRNSRYSLLHESVLLPRIWEQQIAKHDVYFLYLFPTQMIARRPSVWFAAEPLRMMYDLRLHAMDKDSQVSVHFYPKQAYDSFRVSDLEAMLSAIEKVDAWSRFDRLATNSRLMGGYIENLYGRKPDCVAYPGIDKIAKFSKPPAFDKVLCIGRLWQHKRLDVILEAMALTRSSNQLIFVGDGPEKPKLIQRAKDLGISENVRFIDSVSMAERERLYRECTCCVYTAVREPFGMVPLEAAAAGRPVVCTPGGGYGEILTGASAIFVPPEKGEIAKAIHRLMSNPDLAMEMGRAGQKSVAPFTWDRTASLLRDLFEETGKGKTGMRSGCAPTNSSEAGVLIGAHYYPWYRTGKNPVHWNENTDCAGVIDFPVRGPYASHHRAVVKRHLKYAQQAAIDFFIVNLQIDFNGLDAHELAATEKIFAMVEEQFAGFRLALLLAIDSEDPQVVFPALQTVRERFLDRPCYLRFNGKPVQWYYFNDTFQGLLYYHRREFLKIHPDTCRLATGDVAFSKLLPRVLRKFFDGWCFYSPLVVGCRKTREPIWEENYRNVVEDGALVNTFTISPGYDDRHLTAAERLKNRYRQVSRKGLKTYEHMQSAALALRPQPHYVIVTSFNEFHENTHIEPSEKFGERYLTSTMEFKKKINENRS